jgi:hypothetical protein
MMYKDVRVVKGNCVLSLLTFLLQANHLRGFAGFYFFILIRDDLNGREPYTIAHEYYHIIRMKELGYWTWMFKYVTNKQFRQAEERDAEQYARYSVR